MHLKLKTERYSSIQDLLLTSAFHRSLPPPRTILLLGCNCRFPLVNRNFHFVSVKFCSLVALLLTSAFHRPHQHRDHDVLLSIQASSVIVSLSYFDFLQPFSPMSRNFRLSTGETDFPLSRFHYSTTVSQLTEFCHFFVRESEKSLEHANIGQ